MLDDATLQRSEARRVKQSEPVEIRLVMFYFIATLVFLFIALLGGMLVDLQLVGWNPSRGLELFSPGRWQMLQTDALAYGFLTNALFGCLHWIVPRLTLRPFASRELSYFVFILWQAVMLATVVGILADEAQGVGLGETPVFVDPWALIALLLMSLNIVAPIRSVKGPLPEALWYVLAAALWMPLTYAMGNFAPQYFLSGTAAGIVQGLFRQDLLGLCFAALSWGTIYFFVPLITGKPIWSRRLSRIGFWGLAFFCPPSGVRDFLLSPIPFSLQIAAVVATVAFEFSVMAAIVNLLLTIRSAGQPAGSNLPLRWVYTGMILYFIASLQGALQTMFTFQALTHFTDFEAGQLTLLIFGVFVFWLLGIMTYLLPRLLGRPWYRLALCQWHYWLSTIGVVLVYGDLVLAGILQGYWWGSLQPWETSIDGSRPFWIFRVFAELMIFAGQLCFFCNIYRTWKAPARADDHAKSAVALPVAGATLFESKAMVLWVAGRAIFAIALVANLLVAAFTFNNSPERSTKELPNPNLMYEFEDLARRYPGRSKKFGEPTREAAAAALRLGRQVYVGEGCWQCHSQFVRPVANEPRRWGPVSETWEYQNELQRPVMFGTRRNWPGFEPRRGTTLERLARHALVPTDAYHDRFANARLQLALRRCAQQTQPAWSGGHHVRPMARFVAQRLSVLRTISIDRAVAASNAGSGRGKVISRLDFSLTETSVRLATTRPIARPLQIHCIIGAE